MQFFLIQLPDGTTVQVRAPGPAQAVQLVKTAYSGKFGATDLSQITVREGPHSQPYAPTTPALNFAVQDYPQGGQQPSAGTGTGAPGTPTQEQPVTSPLPPPPNPNPQGTRYPERDASGDFYEPGLRTSYRQGLEQRGVASGSAFGAFARQQFDPTSAMFQLRSSLGLGIPQGDNPFQQYTASGTGPLGQARETFGELFRRSQNPTDDVASAYTKGLLPTDNPGSQQAGRQGLDLALQSRGGGLPSYLANYLRSRLPGEYEETQPNTNWLDFLNRRLQLGG